MKKFIIAVLLALTILLPFTKNVKAAGVGTWYNQPYNEWFTKVYDNTNPQEIFGERYTNAQVQWVMYGLFSFIFTGGDQSKASAMACFMSGDTGQCAQSAVDKLFPKKDTGAINKTSPLAVFTNRPISGIGYVTNLAKNWHLIPEAKAQGFGFEAATPILNIWRVSRNIAFTVLTLIMIVMAFMIMFRVKISPQLVIGVQSALPKVIFAMILITFSYAIAGFLIDLTYVVLGVISAFLTTGAAGTPLTHLTWSEMFSMVTRESNVFELMFGFSTLFVLISFYNIFTINVAGSIFIFIFSLIAFFILLFYEIKTIFLVLKTFAMIMLGIIIAPIQILTGAISQNGGFKAWLMSMLSNLAVYPVIFVMFFLAHFFLIQAVPQGILEIDAAEPNRSGFSQFSPFDIYYQAIETESSGTAVWDPPLTFGTSVPNLVWLVIAYSIIVLVPKTAEIIKGVMTQRPFDYGSAVGESFGTAGKVTGFAGGAADTYLARTTTKPSDKRTAKLITSILGQIGRR